MTRDTNCEESFKQLVSVWILGMKADLVRFVRDRIEEHRRPTGS